MNEYNSAETTLNLSLPNTKNNSYQLTWQDIHEGLRQWPIWLMMAWQDIRIRYRRSVLGPFWITISMAINIYTMGLLYGKLFRLDLAVYYPYLATGILAWSLISTLITEGSNIFVESDQFLKQMKMPYSTFVFRTIARNFIIFSHNLLVLIPIYLIFHIKVSWITPLALVGVAIFWVNAVAYTGLISILGTRFRDLPQLVNSLVQVVFFITPIMWADRNLPEQYHFVIRYNPFAQYISLLRQPFLNQMPSAYTWLVTLGLTAFGLIMSFLLFARYRARIVYWL